MMGWEPIGLLKIQVSIEHVVMTMVGFSTLPNAPELKPHHQIQFSVIPMIIVGGWVLPILQRCSRYIS